MQPTQTPQPVASLPGLSPEQQAAYQRLSPEQQAAYQIQYQQYQQQAYAQAAQQTAQSAQTARQQAPNFQQPAPNQPQAPQPTTQQTAKGKKPSKGKKGKKAVEDRPKQNPNSSQNALEIAEIRDDIVIMNDGSFRAVVMVKSINFDLMSPEEREAVEFAFQHFVNSLYFEIQIAVRSRKIDMDSYIKRLQKIRMSHDNMLLSLLMEDYIYYINALVDQTNIMAKEFYVTVPYYRAIDLGNAKKAASGFFGGMIDIFRVNKNTEKVTINEKDFVKAKTELANRIGVVTNGLGQININSTRLNTEALIELYYNYYNPDTAAHQTLASIDSLESPYVSKGQGEAPKPNLQSGF